MPSAPERLPARPFALPNLLTYARIAAVPVVVALLYWQSILDGGLWLRWVALAIFIAAGITDILDGYFARMWGQQSSLGRMLDPIADKLLVASCLLMLAADGHHPRLVAAGRDHHSVPRNPGVGPARISRRTAGQRAGDAARQMEDVGQLVAVGFLIAGEAGDEVVSARSTQIGLRCCGCRRC